jgi:hypothetical protein
MHGCPESNLLPVSGLASGFQVLREELEISSAGEQLSWLRQRAALAQLYDDYTRAQADPPAFLYPERSGELPAESLERLGRGREHHHPPTWQRDATSSFQPWYITILST